MTVPQIRGRTSSTSGPGGGHRRHHQHAPGLALICLLHSHGHARSLRTMRTPGQNGDPRCPDGARPAHECRAVGEFGVSGRLMLILVGLGLTPLGPSGPY